MKEVQDRVVQFSNRYKLTDAGTGTELGTYDFTEVTGTVQQAGTPIDKELFDSIKEDIDECVRYTAQTLSEEQKAQARENIGVTDETSVAELAEEVDKIVDGTTPIANTVRYNAQPLNSQQQTQARTNIGAASDADVTAVEGDIAKITNGTTPIANTVRYNAQTLTAEQQEQARENIGALGEDDIKINLNGSSVSSPAFYAPTTSGTAGQVLKSMGAGQAPVWANETVDIGGAVVTLGASLTYNGQEQTQTVTSVVLNGIPLEQGQDYSVTGNKATNAGTYSLTITGINDYKGTIGVEWVLNKAQSTISVQPTEMTINGAAGTTQTATITYNGGGGISVQTGSASVATAERSGNTITVTSVGNGNTTITISTVSDQNWLAASCEIDVTVNAISSTLNENTWATIKATADQDLGANYWEVGDTKQITINGTVGENAMNNYSTWVYIIGFNHNATREGNHLIHFQGFKTAQSSGVDICLTTDYGNNPQDGSKVFNMNHSRNINSGGWRGCDLRYDVLGSTDVNNGNPSENCKSSPVANTLMASIEADLRDAIQPVTKYTDNTGGMSNSPDDITATTDYFWLLSEFELFGQIPQTRAGDPISAPFANQYEADYQEQYAYYANGNSKVKYRDTSTSSSAAWWCRSASRNNGFEFCHCETNGIDNTNSAIFSYGLAPAFAV